MLPEAVTRLRSRFGGRCGYCGVEEVDVGATLTVEHHRPRIRGGGDDEDNLVYACARCNEHKGSYWHAADPPGIALLHPGRDDLRAHVRELEDGRLEGVTEEGDFFIHRLRLNRAPLVRYRARRSALRRAEEEIEAGRRRIRELEARVEALHGTIAAVDDEIDRER
jgi:hypothetical protein